MLSSQKRPVETKLLLLILTGALLVLIGSMLVMFRVRQTNVELVGTTTAQTVADQLFGLRTFYSNEVVPRAREGGLALNHNWDSQNDTLPVPASLIKAVGADFEATHEGTVIRTYSRYPWPHRAANETYDEFEMAAIDQLERDPSQPYYEVVEYKGQTAIRYAVADVMGESCVACHNSHAESPKTDWAVGDVRGVLEIVLPVEAAQAGITQGIGILGLIIASGLALLAFALWRYMRNLIFKPLNNIIDTTNSVDAGNLAARAHIENNDEIGYMAHKFNEMLDRTTSTLQASQEENARMQHEISVLLREVTTVASGDLTVDVSHGEGITGQIGSSVDYMVSQLRNIITDVKDASVQVSESTAQIQSTATVLSDASEHQSKQIMSTSEAIKEMNASIRQVSENSALSATIGEQARLNAQKGAVAVDNTIDGMGKIREQVTQSAQHIKQLGERSAEIGNFLKTISEISERTSILALNAAIQASIAGEAGSGFAVVAEEVEILAERSAEATKEIESLVRTIQAETNNAVTSMQGAMHEVDSGSELAEEAGRALDEVEVVSQRLNDVLKEIAEASQRQRHGSQTIEDAMGELAIFTQESAEGTKQANQSIRELAALADSLRSSVSTFKLDKNGGSATDSGFMAEQQ